MSRFITPLAVVLVSLAFLVSNAWCEDAPQPLALRAYLFREAGEFQSAIDDLNSVVELEPHNHTRILSRASLWYQMREFSRARDDCTEGLKLGRDAETFVRLRALCQLRLGEPKAAVEDISHALELGRHKKLDRALLAEALIWDADDRTAENIDRAVEIAEELCAEERCQNPKSLRLLARILSGAGEWSRAIEAQRDALRLTSRGERKQLGIELWALQQHEVLVGNWDSPAADQFPD